VLLFSAVLKENGAMNRAIAALGSVVRDARFTVAIIPAVIGLLPVVGGAMLSPPWWPRHPTNWACRPSGARF